MTAIDGFFAIGKPQWMEACGLGLNPAVAYLVLARGTGHDNITTRWSAEAVRVHAGISWPRAKTAVELLDGTGAIIAAITRKGDKPTRKLAIPKDAEHRLWLPNALVTGAGIELPPVAKLRQSQNLEHLQTFIELYGVQDLAGDGGLPRSLVRASFTRERICEQGPFIVYGFRRDSSRSCWSDGPLSRFAQRKVESGSAAWACLAALENMGLLESVDYLAESDSPDAELLHPLTGDAAVADALLAFTEALPEVYQHAPENFDHVLPLPRHIADPAVIGVSRLVYRPHTKRTAAWFAQHRQVCDAYAQRYNALAAGDFVQAARIVESTSRVIKGYQGVSSKSRKSRHQGLSKDVRASAPLRGALIPQQQSRSGP